MQIRKVEAERDAADVVALIREAIPAMTINAASWLHRLRSAPPRTRAAGWVAVTDGGVAGYVEAYLHPFNGNGQHGYVNVMVAGAHRRRGIGSALYERGLEHARTLEPALLVTDFVENPAGVQFAEARGLELARGEQIAILDPHEVREQPPADVVLRSFNEIDPHDAYAVDEAASHDMPTLGDVREASYDEWAQHILVHPLVTLDGSFVAYVDGEPAACSVLSVDRETGRATNMFTGTVPAFRGRGLGRACKLATTSWAARNGVTQISTWNDETNAPMLAINRSLGYKPAGRRVEYALQL